MKILYRIVGLLFLTLVLTSVVYAKGGSSGGGEAPPACSADTWDCSGWSDCSASGTQTRSCSLSFDCPSVDTPKPAESQSCTPACSKDEYDCSAWSNCSADGTRTRTCSKSFDCPSVDTPVPVQSGSCTPACTEDVWTCGAYGECGADGFQGRTCTLTTNCESVETPSPATIRECDTPAPTSSAPAQPAETASVPEPVSASALGELLDECAVMDGMRDRIECRMQREEEAYKSGDHSGGYGNSVEEDVPEECLTMVDNREEFDSCLVVYANLRDCWSTYEIGHPQRFTCVQNSLGLSDISAQKAACNTDSCTSELTGKVHWLAKAYMYDAEERAEQFFIAGAPFDATVDIITNVLEAKIAFNNATSYEGRLQAMVQLRQDWADYVSEIKSVIE